MSLDTIKDRLLALHDGLFQDDTYLSTWCSPPIAELFVKHGVLFRPREEERVYIDHPFGPYECIRNAIAYATEHPGLLAYWSFSLYFDDRVNRPVWWMHAFCLSPDGTTYDPAAPSRLGSCPPIFFGIPWCVELYQVLAQADGPFIPVQRAELPVVLQRELCEQRSVTGS